MHVYITYGILWHIKILLLNKAIKRFILHIHLLFFFIFPTKLAILTNMGWHVGSLGDILFVWPRLLKPIMEGYPFGEEFQYIHESMYQRNEMKNWDFRRKKKKISDRVVSPLSTRRKTNTHSEAHCVLSFITGATLWQVCLSMTCMVIKLED